MEALLLLLILGLIIVAVFKVLGGVFGGAAGKVVKDGHVGMGKALLGVFQPKLLERSEGASFAGPKEVAKVLHPSHEGLVLDGDLLRLTPRKSFEHCMVIAPTGAGKTTRFVEPNLLSLDNCSFVVTDPSGELHERTAGSLQQRGFDVLLLDPANPSRSLGYNPLAGIASHQEIQELADAIVLSVGDVGQDSSFWNQGAGNILSVLIRCLGVAGSEHLNLGNVLHLVQNFGTPEVIKQFLVKYCDQASLGQLSAVMNLPDRTQGGFLANANLALRSLNDPDMAALFASNDIDFRQLRRRKTALFLSVPSERIGNFRFLLSLFYTDLFQSLMKDRPETVRAQGKTCLPVYCLMDEFGHTSLPNFGTIASSIRKYDVSLSIVLQDFAQLVHLYGPEEATTIVGGAMNSQIYYPGLSQETAALVEALLGKQVVHEYRMGRDGPKRIEQNLMNADRVRTMNEDEAILISGNHEPMRFRTISSFRHRRFARMRKIPRPDELVPRNQLKPFIPVDLGN